jgi:hypothetical protein
MFKDGILCWESRAALAMSGNAQSAVSRALVSMVGTIRPLLTG